MSDFVEESLVMWEPLCSRKFVVFLINTQEVAGCRFISKEMWLLIW
jgi:hypothetical protein